MDLLAQPLAVGDGADHDDPASYAGQAQLLSRIRRCLASREFVCIKLRMLRNSRDIVKRLKSEGFELVSVKGSHHKFRKSTIIVVVPHPKKDLPLGTARSIARRVGWN